MTTSSDNFSDSPCTFQCRLESVDNQEMCISCGRLRDEIVNWSQLDSIDKENVFRISNERLLRKVGKI